MTAGSVLRGSLPAHSRYVQPLLISRLGPLIPVLVVIAGLWDLPLDLPLPIAAAALLPWFALRCLRMGVVITPTEVIVRGLLWDRRMPRGAVVDLTDTPSLVWRDEEGRERRTPVHSLRRGGGLLASVAAYNQARTDEIRRLLLHRRRGRRRKPR